MMVKFLYVIYIESNFSETKNFIFNIPSNESRHGEEHFHIKKYLNPSQGKYRLKRSAQKRNFAMTKPI